MYTVEAPLSFSGHNPNVQPSVQLAASERQVDLLGNTNKQRKLKKQGTELNEMKDMEHKRTPSTSARAENVHADSNQAESSGSSQPPIDSFELLLTVGRFVAAVESGAIPANVSLLNFDAVDAYLKAARASGRTKYLQAMKSGCGIAAATEPPSDETFSKPEAMFELLLSDREINGPLRVSNKAYSAQHQRFTAVLNMLDRHFWHIRRVWGSYWSYKNANKDDSASDVNFDVEPQQDVKFQTNSQISGYRSYLERTAYPFPDICVLLYGVLGTLGISQPLTRFRWPVTPRGGVTIVVIHTLNRYFSGTVADKDHAWTMLRNLRKTHVEQLKELGMLSERFIQETSQLITDIIPEESGLWSRQAFVAKTVALNLIPSQARHHIDDAVRREYGLLREGEDASSITASIASKPAAIQRKKWTAEEESLIVKGYEQARKEGFTQHFGGVVRWRSRLDLRRAGRSHPCGNRFEGRCSQTKDGAERTRVAGRPGTAEEEKDEDLGLR
ncbi:hypothetical protein PRZ48_004963 [Zasmidium cellare]|uniref:Myb-like domain-containing protein n=1 Tax=Zasmidium cellare TaxID=395010 RepID=A0ABR0ES70_ZASCE|nr:hypothetical protein PRZ48_004963 [Zasmidium cellare]